MRVLLLFIIIIFPTTLHNIFHHTLNMHYLEKVNSSNLLQTLKKMQTRKLNTLIFSAHNLHTYIICFNLISNGQTDQGAILNAAS